MMKKALYVGIFSGTNIGDLAISNEISEFLMGLGKYDLDLMDFNTIQKIGKPSTTINKNFIVGSEPSIKGKLKKKMLNSVVYKKNSRIILKGYNIITESSMYHLHNLYFRQYEDIIKDYEIIFIGGGNLLMSISTNQWAIKINKLIEIAKNKNKTVAIVSVGAGPIILNKSRRLFKEALNKVDYISVRDEYSKTVITELLKINAEIHVSGDPVFLLKNKYINKDKTKENKNIAMSIMPFGHKCFPNLSTSCYKDYSYYLEMYKDIIEHIVAENSLCTFHLFSTEYYDYNSIIELYDYILEKSEIVEKVNLKIQYIESLEELLYFYQNQDLLIGTRMHSLIIALTQSLPIIAISWQEKVSSFMKYVNLEQYCYSLNEIDYSLDRIYRDTQELLSINTQVAKNRYIECNLSFIREL